MCVPKPFVLHGAHVSALFPHHGVSATPFRRWLICRCSLKSNLGRSLVATPTIAPPYISICVVYSCSSPHDQSYPFRLKACAATVELVQCGVGPHGRPKNISPAFKEKPWKRRWKCSLVSVYRNASSR